MATESQGLFDTHYFPLSGGLRTEGPWCLPMVVFGVVEWDRWVPVNPAMVIQIP